MASDRISLTPVFTRRCPLQTQHVQKKSNLNAATIEPARNITTPKTITHAEKKKEVI